LGFSRARFDELRRALGEADWDQVLAGTVDEAAQKFTDIVLEKSIEYIPKRTIRIEKSSHP